MWTCEAIPFNTEENTVQYSKYFDKMLLYMCNHVTPAPVAPVFVNTDSSATTASYIPLAYLCLYLAQLESWPHIYVSLGRAIEPSSHWMVSNCYREMRLKRSWRSCYCVRIMLCGQCMFSKHSSKGKSLYLGCSHSVFSLFSHIWN